MHHHHEGGVGLVEVGEVVEGGELGERAEVGDGRSAAEGQNDALAHASGERVATHAVLGRGDLSGSEGRGEESGRNGGATKRAKR